MDPREQQQAEVESNYRTFLSDLPKLVQTNKGQFAVHRHQRLVDVFASFSAAIVDGNRTHPDRIFSVQEITEEPLDLGGLPYASDSRDFRSERS